MKMKKSDIGVVAVMYFVCAFFYSQMLQLKADSQTYPRFTILLLFGLTTLYLVQMLVNWKRHGVQQGRDEAFLEFQSAQFFVCLAATILYLVLMYFLGFYISTVLFMAAVLLYLRVPYLHAGITIIVILALIYFAFSRFLGVRLPVGTLIKALR